MPKILEVTETPVEDKRQKKLDKMKKKLAEKSGVDLEKEKKKPTQTSPSPSPSVSGS